MSDPQEDFTKDIGPVAERHRQRVLCQIELCRRLLNDFEAAARTIDGARWDSAAQALGAGIIELSIMTGLVRGSYGSTGEA